MYSKTPGKAFKGTVQVKSSNERLQLVFSYGGKRHYLSTGLVDTPTNRRLAQIKAREIEKDILYERFDPTLEKYKPQSALSTTNPMTLDTLRVSRRQLAAENFAGRLVGKVHRVQAPAVQPKHDEAEILGLHQLPQALSDS